MEKMQSETCADASTCRLPAYEMAIATTRTVEEREREVEASRQNNQHNPLQHG